MNLLMQKRNIFNLLLLLFSVNCFAIDPAITAANNHYFEILKRVEIIKNKSLSLVEREKEFSNFANEFAEPGANWQTLKVDILEIIIADASFWAKQIIQFPAIQEKLIKDFEMDWYFDTSSNYPQKLSLAKIELTRELEKIALQKIALEHLLRKLNSVKPSTL